MTKLNCDEKNEKIFIKTGLNMHFSDGEIISLAELNCPNEKIQKKLEKIINIEQKKGGKKQKGGTRWTIRCHAKIMAAIAWVIFCVVSGFVIVGNNNHSVLDPTSFCSFPVLPEPPSVIDLSYMEF
jgi:hypothetical protein